MMEQIWFVNAACSAGCSLSLFQKNRQSLQPKITCSKIEFKPGKLPILNHCYFVADGLILNGLEVRVGLREGNIFLCCYYNGLNCKVQWLWLGSENVLQKHPGGVSSIRLD